MRPCSFARTAFLTLICIALGMAGCVRQPGAELQSESALRDEARYRLSKISGQIGVNGLRKPVTVIRDTWGVPHIYAETLEDLFFAQGFVAAQDRLYQMEIWRRTGRGELAAVFGPEFIERDRIARLMRYRGNREAEWESYSPRTKTIAESFAAGINASIAKQRGERGERLPIEFTLLDFEPGQWRAEDILLRTAGLQMTYNATNEIARARLVAGLGPREALRWMPADPATTLRVPPGMDYTGIDQRVLQVYRSVTGTPTLETTDGSNNWVISGKLSATGAPLMASDPHRQMALPSLRYATHLVGPGWNVIGAGEPALPGVVLGHNEHIGFGFTIAAYDQVDLYVERVNHGKPTQYRYRNEWLPMRIERELLAVRGYSAPLSVELKFTRHGPVIWESPDDDYVVAVRWAGAEPGTAGYLGSLAMDAVTNWEQFLEAVKRWKIPPENILYGDREGNIGWLAAGLVPQRRGWNGLLPVPGESGDFEWDSFLPTEELPQEFNPERGFIATANHKILPENYRHEVGFDWTPPYRFRRIEEVLLAGGKFTLEDFQKLQHDELSLPGRIWRQILQAHPDFASRDAALARQQIRQWDGVLDKASAGGAVYSLFSRHLRYLFVAEVLPEAARPVLEARLDHRVLLKEFSALPLTRRLDLLERALAYAWQTASKEMGSDLARWGWGRMHFAIFRHPLANTAARAAAFNLGPVPRGGDAFTVNATGGSGLQQTHGASYRQIINFADWDASVFTSSPGQSGQPGSQHYGDLLPMWANHEYAPLLYSREKVEEHAAHRLELVPR